MEIGLPGQIVPPVDLKDTEQDTVDTTRVILNCATQVNLLKPLQIVRHQQIHVEVSDHKYSKVRTRMKTECVICSGKYADSSVCLTFFTITWFLIQLFY